MEKDVMVTIDENKFVSLYQHAFGDLKPEGEAGLRSIIQSINQDNELHDQHWVAYMLATVKHECANKWQPIEEFGKGEDRPYGQPDETTGNTYYGRGYVQLTWKGNYQKMSRALGLDLVEHPERVLQRDIAYKVMSSGMRNGSFTGKKLQDFIHETECDYFNAREIINAHDRAELIEGYARQLSSILKNCTTGS